MGDGFVERRMGTGQVERWVAREREGLVGRDMGGSVEGKIGRQKDGGWLCREKDG
jgi:hypothetical protein